MWEGGGLKREREIKLGVKQERGREPRGRLGFVHVVVEIEDSCTDGLCTRENVSVKKEREEEKRERERERNVT